MSNASQSLDRSHETFLTDGLAAVVSYPVLKQAVDFLGAVILLVLTAPIFLVMAALVKLTSRGPVIYSQRRVGLHGKIYTIYKIRSMTDGCERTSGACWSKPGDSRVTPVGRFLRKTHLDELPQLWNVLRGEMSLIGPRPERPEFVVQLEKALPNYRRRLDLKPGVTGLAQVQLPPDTTLESVRDKLAYDLYYVNHPGLWLDVSILLGTVTHVLGFSARATRVLCGLPAPEAVQSGVEETNETPNAEPVVVAA